MLCSSVDRNLYIGEYAVSLSLEYCSSKMLVPVYQTILCQFPEDCDLNKHHCGNLKSHIESSAFKVSEQKAEGYVMSPLEKKEHGVLYVMVERVLHAMDIMGKSYDQSTKVTHGKSDVSVHA
jgi:hypothetical protein